MSRSGWFTRGGVVAAGILMVFYGILGIPVTASAATATQLAFTGVPASTTAGQTFSVDVSAEDGGGVIDTSYTGTVHFTSSDPQAVLPSNYTFTPSDNGTATFNSVALKSVGSGTRTVTATDTANSALTVTTSPITVDPAATSKLVVSTTPPEVAGTAFPIVVTAEDPYNNTTPAYTGTVHLTSTDGAAQLPADYTFTGGGAGNDNGVHTFTPGVATGGVTLYTSGSTVTATDTVTSSITGAKPTISLASPSTDLTAPPSSVQIQPGGTAVDFTLDASFSGQPLTLPSDVAQPATTYAPGSYTVNCPTQLVQCVVGNAGTVTLSGTGPFTIPVEVTQINDGYFDPQSISLSLGIPTTGDVALPATATATANVISEVNPPPGAGITVTAPGAVTLPAGGQMNFPVALSSGGTPVNAAGDIVVHYTVQCPLPSAVLTCSSIGTATIGAGSSGTTIPVTIASVNANAYFSSQQVTVQLTSIDPPGQQIPILGTGQASGSITTTVAPPKVTLTGPSTLTVPAQAGNQNYLVSLSPNQGGTGSVQVAVPIVVTFTAGGTPGYSTPAEPGVAFTSPVVTTNTASCPTGTSCVIFQPGANGLDPVSLPISVDFLSPGIHGPNLYFQLQLTGTTPGVLGPQTSVQTVISDTLGSGYWLVGTDGGVFAFGSALFSGSAGGIHLVAPVVALAPTPTGRGYWLVASDGGVFAYGDAQFFGSMGGSKLNGKIVGIAATPTGFGYYLVGNDGGVFAFGDARFSGSMSGQHLNGSIVEIQSTRSGNGYYMVGSDGGVFAFGDARFFGSLPQLCGYCAISSPLLGISVNLSGDGYWLGSQNGGVFAFGNAKFYGSASGPSSHKHYVAITATLSGNGYWLLATDGSVTNFGGADALGSVSHTNAPLENMAGD